MRFIAGCLLACMLLPSSNRAETPQYVILPTHSWIKFSVKASVALAGRFDKWDATLTFA